MDAPLGYESAWPSVPALDVGQLLATGAIEGPYVRAGHYPITRRIRRSLGLFWRALAAFLTDTKGPKL